MAHCVPTAARGSLLSARQVIDGKYPEYLNDSFVGNRGSNSWKLNMLVQPKFNSKFGHNYIRYQGPRLWNGVDKEFKLAAKL